MPVKKILFITCSRIGDAVLTTGILAYIEKKMPNASVTVVADPLVADLFTDFPLMKALIPFPKEKHSWHWVRLWQQVAAETWDWVIDLRGSMIAYALRAKRRTTWKSINHDRRHKVEQLAACAHIPITSPTLWVSEGRLEKVSKELPNVPFLALAPAANWVGKQWPLDNFIELLRRFFDHFNSAKVIVFAAPSEQEMVQPLLAAFPEKVVSRINQGTLLDTAAALKHSTLFIGNDSGLMHMSAAMQTPTIGLFGPSREENYGPWQLQGTNRNTVIRIPDSYDALSKKPGFSHKSQTCFMTDLTVDIVWAVLLQEWQRNSCKL